MARLRYIVKTGKKGPNKDVQDGFFQKKNKACCTIIWQVKVGTSTYDSG